MADCESLKIVKEDILRLLGEKNEKMQLPAISQEIKNQHNLIMPAIRELHKEGFIDLENDWIISTIWQPQRSVHL